MTQWVLSIVEANTAGSPTDTSVKWTDLRPFDIAEQLKKNMPKLSHMAVSNAY